MFVLAAIAVLAMLIVVHELGHFMAARLQGIYANKFSIGFGPILWKYQGPETEYALRAIPLGGFVGFPDEDPDSTIPPNDPNLMRNRPVLDRAIVISAGVIANLIFAYFLLVSQIGLFGTQEFLAEPGARVEEIKSDLSAAAKNAGLQSGDIILAVNGKPLDAQPDPRQPLIQAIASSPKQPVALTVKRGDQTLPTITVTPDANPEGKGIMGVQLTRLGKVEKKHIGNPLEVLSLAANDFQKIVVLTVQMFGQLFTKFSQVSGQISGPVKIVEEGAKLAENDATSLFSFASLISINLAVINILPLPALDGGHLVLLLLEGIGKPLPKKLQEGIMQTGLVLILGLGVFLIIKDTSQLGPVHQLLNR
jgi:membrane-associated protease RseP (regulator of RpoE activity)